MGFIKPYRLEILLLILFSIFYFFLRFYHILELPIFTDEAIYVRWAQIANQDANWRFISLTDGKQPMFVWLTIIFMKLIKDPLLAGRSVSVFAGFFTMIGLYFLARELFKNRYVGIVSSFLYLWYPFAFVYDRMALYDSLVGTFAVWSLYFEVLLVRSLRLDIALLAALIIGGGLLNKTSGFFSLYLIPLAIILIDFKNKQRVQQLFKFAAYCLVVIGLGNLYYSILRLSPFFHIISQKNSLFVYPWNEWILHPFTFFWGNLLIGEKDWLIRYVTPPVLIAVVVSFFVDKKFIKEKILLLLWFIIPFIYLALFGNVIYPRFIFFMTLFLLPLASYTLFFLSIKIKNKIIYYLILFVVFFFFLRSDYFILLDFAHAPIPISDLNQYNNDWPAGGGVRESTDFFKKEALKGKIFVATQGTFGLMPASYEMYLLDNKNIELKGFWPISETIPTELTQKSKKMPVYFVFHEPCPACYEKMRAPLTWSVVKVFEYKKFASLAYLTVYQVKPQ